MSAENPQQPHRPKQDGSELHYPCAGGSHSGTSSNQDESWTIKKAEHGIIDILICGVGEDS